MTEKNKNLALWNRVQTTNPRYAKEFTKPGGFKGTAISAHYRIQMATEQFGPIGIGWGYEEVEHLIAEGVWMSKVKLWYKLDGERGEVVQWGATQLVQNRKGSEFVDEDAAKKSITDGVTKCLSLLGFNADIHMGKWEDDEYYQWAKEKAKRDEREGRDGGQGDAPAPSSDQQPPAQQQASPPAAGAPPAGQQKLTPKQQANVYYLKLRRLDPGMADQINGLRDITDEDRADRFGKALANGLYKAVIDEETRKDIKVRFANDPAGMIDAFIKAYDAQEQAKKATNTGAAA